jgi:hypothetical protein
LKRAASPFSGSGGPEPAFIGSLNRRENFHGVIDEVALYDFALTPDEIAEHHERSRRGETYFGPQPTSPKAARWQAITRITEGQTRVFNARTGLAATPIQARRASKGIRDPIP